jgi:beta-alanine degradation protein BauB
MFQDPVTTNPEHYRVILENERVRVLEYSDGPGDRTTPHDHPESVMYALTSFRRRLYAGGGQRDVEIEAGTAAWLPAQRHAGHNIGATPTHVIFVELKAHLPLRGLHPTTDPPVVGPELPEERDRVPPDEPA